MHSFAVQLHAAFIGHHCARQGFDQAGLASSVIANDCQNFTSAQFEIDAIQSGHTAITFDQARGLENNVVSRH